MFLDRRSPSRRCRLAHLLRAPRRRPYRGAAESFHIGDRDKTPRSSIESSIAKRRHRCLEWTLLRALSCRAVDLRMTADPVPDSVRQLIAALIDSIPELEAILLLREYRERTWTSEQAGNVSM